MGVRGFALAKSHARRVGEEVVEVGLAEVVRQAMTTTGQAVEVDHQTLKVVMGQAVEAEHATEMLAAFHPPQAPHQPAIAVQPAEEQATETSAATQPVQALHQPVLHQQRPVLHQPSCASSGLRMAWPSKPTL
jgi:hypothetical protein